MRAGVKHIFRGFFGVQRQRAWAKRVREADGTATVGAGTRGVETVEAGLGAGR